MIAVAGLNSAIDKLLEVEALTPGLVIRADEARAWPGGKGAHVAMCAAALGEPVRLTGLVDDAHRDLFVEWMRARRVDFHAIDTPVPIRTCLAIRERGGRITEILEPGPSIDADVCEAVFHTVVNVCRRAAVAVMSGSLPAGMSSATYRDLVSALPDTRVFVDASGDALRHALQAPPYAIKPNRAEAEALTGRIIDSPEAAARAAQELMTSGVKLVVISLGAGGAVACRDDHVWHAMPPAVSAVNEVGAGDCLVGAMAVALARRDDLADALRLGVAAGTAKALSPETGAVRRSDIDGVLPAVRVVTVS